MGEGPRCLSMIGRDTSTNELLVLTGELLVAFSSSHTRDGDHLTKSLSSRIGSTTCYHGGAGGGGGGGGGNGANNRMVTEHNWLAPIERWPVQPAGGGLITWCNQLAAIERWPDYSDTEGCQIEKKVL